jgi:hypothetical protein
MPFQEPKECGTCHKPKCYITKCGDTCAFTPNTKTACEENLPNLCHGDCAKAEPKDGWEAEFDREIAKKNYGASFECTDYETMMSEIKSLLRTLVAKAEIRGAEGCRDAVTRQFDEMFLKGDEIHYECWKAQWRQSVVAADSHVKSLTK